MGVQYISKFLQACKKRGILLEYRLPQTEKLAQPLFACVDMMPLIINGSAIFFNKLKPHSTNQGSTASQHQLQNGSTSQHHGVSKQHSPSAVSSTQTALARKTKGMPLCNLSWIYYFFFCNIIQLGTMVAGCYLVDIIYLLDIIIFAVLFIFMFGVYHIFAVYSCLVIAHICLFIAHVCLDIID